MVAVPLSSHPLRPAAAETLKAASERGLTLMKQFLLSVFIGVYQRPVALALGNSSKTERSHIQLRPARGASTVLTPASRRAQVRPERCEIGTCPESDDDP